MKLKEKENAILLIFFLFKDLNPFFFGLVMDSVKNSKNISLLVKKKIPLNLRISNTTLALFMINLNIFSDEDLNLNSHKKKVMAGIEVQFNELNLLFNKSIFFDIYLNKYNKKSSFETRKSIQIIENLDNI
jgi:hypothetical protein